MDKEQRSLIDSVEVLTRGLAPAWQVAVLRRSIPKADLALALDILKNLP